MRKQGNWKASADVTLSTVKLIFNSKRDVQNPLTFQVAVTLIVNKNI